MVGIINDNVGTDNKAITGSPPLPSPIKKTEKVSKPAEKKSEEKLQKNPKLN